MKVRVLLLDETEHWSEDIVHRANRIFGIYLYDPDKAVHGCEFTPSYELTFVGSAPEQVPEDDETREAFCDKIMDEDSKCEPISYIHCNTIDQMPEIEAGEFKAGTYSLTHLNDGEWEDMDEAAEYWRGNPGY
jgi:hypothetical protein